MYSMAVNISATSLWADTCKEDTAAHKVNPRSRRAGKGTEMMRRAAAGGKSRGALLALLAVSRLPYEVSGGGVTAVWSSEGAQADEGAQEDEGAQKACEEAYQLMRPVADEAVKQIQESGGSSGEGEQVRLSEIDFDEKLDQREGEAEGEMLRAKADAPTGGEQAVQAQLGVAIRKFHGIKGAERDVGEGGKYLEKAADSGDAIALSNYGYMLANGWGVERNVSAAKENFLKAIEQGEKGGHVGMGFLYYYGLGDVPQNLTAALEHYMVAARQGDAMALFNVGEMYRTGEGIEKNLNTSWDLFRAAAALGHFKAMYMMGLSSWFGWGTSRSCRDATYLLKLVAERGPWGRILRDAYSSLKLGDVPSALKLYLRAAEAGYEVAQCNVAWLASSPRHRSSVLAALGEGKGCNLEAFAEYWWHAAAAQGSGEGLLRLADAAVARGDLEEGFALYARSVKAIPPTGGGQAAYVAEAAVKLGGMHERGEGGGKGGREGREEARFWYQLAKRRGGAGAVAATAAELMMDAGGALSKVVSTVKGWFGSWGKTTS